MATYACKIITYQGRQWTLAELSRLHGVPASTINNRINSGWDIEEAICTPKENRVRYPLPPEFRDGNVVEVIFKTPIPEVYHEMQPQLNTPYIVSARQTLTKEPCYIITLENGKPLIVRPSEFEIFRVTECENAV